VVLSAASVDWESEGLPPTGRRARSMPANPYSQIVVVAVTATIITVDAMINSYNTKQSMFRKNHNSMLNIISDNICKDK